MTVIFDLSPSPAPGGEVHARSVTRIRQVHYLDALATPLPMHLASLAQAYVLPTRAEEDDDEEADTDTAGTATSGATDTNLASALGIIAETTTEEEADLDHELLDAPGLAQAPEESASPYEGQLAVSGVPSPSP